MKFIPYFAFQGNAKEAIDFYIDALDGELASVMLFNEMPPSEDMPIPEGFGDKIMHAEVTVNGEYLYFSDMFPGQNVTKGNSLEINIDCDSEEQLRSMYEKLSVGGTVTMPLDKQFWGSLFGSVTDKYGFGWSLNYTLPQE